MLGFPRTRINGSFPSLLPTAKKVDGRQEHVVLSSEACMIGKAYESYHLSSS